MLKNYFGLNILQSNTPWPLTPFDSYRFWDNGCRWGLTNPSMGIFQWKKIDEWISFMVSHGVKDAIFELSATPTWASSTPQVQNCDYNAGSCGAPIGLAPDGTGKNLLWRRWVAAVSQHFAASDLFIAGYGIWNEFGRQPGRQGIQSISWAGTDEQLVRMAEDARCIITGRGSVTATKETASQVQRTVGLTAPTSPLSTILSPSIGVEPITDQIWHNYITTPGALESAEVVAIHTYDIDVVMLHNNILKFIDNLPEGKPVWSSEGSWGQVVPTDPAAYTTSYIEGLYQLGVKRFYWYAYDNATWAPLWSAKGLTLAGEAYKNCAETMGTGPHEEVS